MALQRHLLVAASRGSQVSRAVDDCEALRCQRRDQAAGLLVVRVIPIDEQWADGRHFREAWITGPDADGDGSSRCGAEPGSKHDNPVQLLFIKLTIATSN